MKSGARRTSYTAEVDALYRLTAACPEERSIDIFIDNIFALNALREIHQKGQSKTSIQLPQYNDNVRRRIVTLIRDKKLNMEAEPVPPYGKRTERQPSQYTLGKARHLNHLVDVKVGGRAEATQSPMSYSA